VPHSNYAIHSSTPRQLYALCVVCICVSSPRKTDRRTVQTDGVSSEKDRRALGLRGRLDQFAFDLTSVVHLADATIHWDLEEFLVV